ncbi:MAG: cadmium-translocating P-type ATPase [Nitrososphaerales archaeon]|nr:cadmium-translocating P-type ATPase [Nitrososphaerales archaeon]
MSGSSQPTIICKLCEVEIPEEKVPAWQKLQVSFTIASTVLFAVALSSEYVLRFPIVFPHITYFVIILLSGHEIIPAALRSVLRRRLDINFLMTVAAFGAFAIGQADEGAAVIYLFSIAEFLEVWASDKARASIATLLKLSPSTVSVKVEGNEIAKHVHDVSVGDIVVVKPGERIPVDGVVRSGSSSVNQAPITGESIPVDKEEGGEVFAGSLNGEGFLEIRTTKPPSETVLSKVVRLVRQAQSEKSPTESFVERFSKFYTPIVVAGAILVALVPPLAFNASFVTWFYRAMILLVVSCPCALTISTPVSMVSSITGAARNGVLVRGGKYIESLAKIRTFLFDKTGTLTTGRLNVSDVISFNPSSSEVLRLAGSLEAMSEHPIAKAVVEKAKEDRLTLSPVAEFESFRGRGIRGVIDGKEVLVGKKELFTQIPEKVLEKCQYLQAQGKSAILVGTSKEIFGIVALKDSVKANAATTVSALKAQGFEVVMISGDNETTTASIANELAIDHYHAEVMPDQKVEEVAHLKEKYGDVVMIGDGVNDAPALAKASVGIAMGALGSDVAIETADIALMRDDLSKIPYVTDLSRKTLGVIKQNITASILVKSAFAILALPGLVTLALAVGVGDMGLSLAVILNAMRLRLVR